MVKDKYWISETKGEYWDVMFGEEVVMSCRAKSRSKVEMQKLLDHFNARVDIEKKGQERKKRKEL